jgi:tetratricopeptide (TPR) repeat protein
MNNSEQDITQLTAYIEGDLSPREKVEIEKRLQTDTEFHQLYRELSILISSLSEEKPSPLRSKIRSWEAELPAIQPQPTQPREVKIPAYRRLFLIIGSIAATVVLTASITLWIFSGNKLSPEDEKFLQYHEAYKSTPSSRGNDIFNLQDAYLLYGLGKYKDAAAVFDRVIETLKQDTSANAKKEITKAYFYLGNSRLSDFSYLEAENALRNYMTLANENHYLYEEAVWYYALSAWMCKDTTTALSYFNKIESDNRHYQKAQELSVILTPK